MKKTLLAGGSVLASILLLGGGTVSAESIVLSTRATSTRPYVRMIGRRPHQALEHIVDRAPGLVLEAQAKALGIGIDELKQDLKNNLKNRRGVRQIAESKGMTFSQYRQNLVGELQQLITSGAATGTDAQHVAKILDRMGQKR